MNWNDKYYNIIQDGQNKNLTNCEIILNQLKALKFVTSDINASAQISKTPHL